MQRTKQIFLGKTIQQIENPVEGSEKFLNSNDSKMLFVTVYDEEIQRYWDIFNDDVEEQVHRFEFSFNTNYYVLNLEIEENGYWVESKSKMQGRVVGNKAIRVGAHLEGVEVVP